MPDDHSELVPPLPIPNRTVKRLCADDSSATSVKVGHRQAVIPKIPKLQPAWGFFFARFAKSSPLIQKQRLIGQKNRPGLRLGRFFSYYPSSYRIDTSTIHNLNIASSNVYDYVMSFICLCLDYQKCTKLCRKIS